MVQIKGLAVFEYPESLMEEFAHHRAELTRDTAPSFWLRLAPKHPMFITQNPPEPLKLNRFLQNEPNSLYYPTTL
jgi:hypothetical protein